MDGVYRENDRTGSHENGGVYSATFLNPAGTVQMINSPRGDAYYAYPPMPQHLRATLVMLLAIAMVSPCGCVRRRLNVRTNPPGALVYVDNQQIGTTPCSVDFTYYGTREIRLVKPGFETLTVNQPIPAPWYQIPPLDFVSENLVPAKIRDNRTVIYDLAPQIIVPREQLVDRANQLRQDTLQYPVAPAGATMPIGPAPPPGVVVPPPGSVPLNAVPFGPPPVPTTATPVVPPPQGAPIVSPPLR